MDLRIGVGCRRVFEKQTGRTSEQTKKEAEKMLDNTSEKCGNDPKFPGYDVVYFRNDGRRTKENAVGINFAKQKVNFNIE